MSARLALRATAAALVLAFFAWLWKEGAITPGSLGWLRVLPLFLLGYLAYALIADLGEAALEGRELGLRSDSPSEARS